MSYSTHSGYVDAQQFSDEQCSLNQHLISMTPFVPNIDDANIRIMQLETQLGRETSPFIPGVDAANERIGELEIELATRQPAAGPAASSATSSAGQPQSGIRRAIAANGGGVIARNSSTEPLVKGAGLARAIAANVRNQSKA